MEPDYPKTYKITRLQQQQLKQVNKYFLETSISGFNRTSQKVMKLSFARISNLGNSKDAIKLQIPFIHEIMLST